MSAETLLIPFCKMPNVGAAAASAILNAGPKHPVAHVPWRTYSYQPSVFFSLAHSGDCLLLKYFVTEQNIRATVTQVNGPVWEDSCVECFLAFDETGYYNFEFNCIGTALVGFGRAKSNRQLLPESLVKTLLFQAQLRNTADGEIQWELTVVIPLAVFLYHPLSSLHGRSCRVNFFKCGDRLPKPHYLSWKNIVCEEPDFHRPEAFGAAQFGAET